ncbi:MAG: hypothetical protein AAB414_00565 [Patescibacteria group bacterium]
MEKIPPHDHLIIKGVISALSKEKEPLTALTYYDPAEPFLPFSNTRRGRFNVEGKILQILGVPPEQIANLTSNQVRATLADGLVGSSVLQGGFLPFFDSKSFALQYRNGPEVARILRDPNTALVQRAGEIANLAELVSRYSDEISSSIEPAKGPQGMLYASNVFASKLLMAAVAYFQGPPAYNKDIRHYANFTAQAVIRNVTQDLPPHIQDIACWAANELQIIGYDGRITALVRDPVEGVIEVKSELFFLPLLVDPEGQPLTLGYLRDYTMKGWERNLTPGAMNRNRKRFFGMVAERRAELKKAREQSNPST